jgi:hypothetical protein
VTVDQPGLFDAPPPPAPKPRPAKKAPADSCPCCQHRTPGGDFWAELVAPWPGWSM